CQRWSHVATDDERCAEAKKIRLIDDAFRRGDLEGLREAVGDPTAVPNGRMPDAIGSCLVYAIYHRSLSSGPCSSSAPIRMRPPAMGSRLSSPHCPAYVLHPAPQGDRMSTTFFGCSCHSAVT